MRLVLSPVGTSIFTNQAGDHRAILNKYSNLQRKDMPQEAIGMVEELATEALDKLNCGNLSVLRSASAELNGIIGLYGNSLPRQSKDMHILIATDTFQGTATAEIIQKVLQKHFVNTQIYTPPGLHTNSKVAFHEGIKDLLKWCDVTLPAFRASRNEIVFNLTGGFKSLQGYLNTIGMFYADRIIYIFETGNEIISIPKLPLRLEMDIFYKHADLFLQLSQSLDGMTFDALDAIPDVMLDCIDNRCVLSTWGALSWNNAKREILSKELIPLPIIVYEDSFRRDFANNDQPDEKVKLQETVAKVSCLLQVNQGDISFLKGGRGGGLLYDNYSGKNSHLGHFRLGQGPRVSCEYKNRTLHLRHFGAHNYVENNP